MKKSKITHNNKHIFKPNFIIFLFLLIANFSNAQWIEQGPGPSFEGQIEGITNRPISGAVNCTTPHPSDSDILYIGAVNGGVWRTVNATAASPSWSYISDDISSQAIGALEFDPTDASNLTLVVANGYTSSIAGRATGDRGIFKTTNGLGPWTNIDPNGDLPSTNFTGLAPRGNTIVVAAGFSGIWRTTNNGDDWVQIDGLGGSGLPFGNAWDLVSDPSDNTILYTTSGSNGVYKSVNSGATWNKVSDAAIDGLLGATIALEIAVGSADNVYVGIVSSVQLTGIFRSGDGGGSWVSLDLPTTNEVAGVTGLFTGGPSGIHLSLAADPSDDNKVYIAGAAQPIGLTVPPFWPNSIGASDFSGRLFRIDASLAAGSQFAPITHNGTINNSSPHADSRDMDFNADGDMIEGDDGGVFIQTAPENVNGDWFTLNGNLSIAEAHSSDWDALSNVPIVGLQDNGISEQNASGSRTWENVSRGDGGVVEAGDIGGVISTRYSSNQNFANFRLRQYNSASSFQTGSQILPLLINSATGIGIRNTDNFSFITPLKLNTQNSSRLLIASSTALYESFNQGANVTQILGQQVNGANFPFDFRLGRDVLVYGNSDNINIIYAGVANNVQIRTAAGGAFSAAAAYPGGFVEGITIDPGNSQNAYVIDANNVYETNNTGGSFDNITGDLGTLDAGALLSIAYVTNSTDDILAVGTTNGVYFSSGPDFDTWAELDSDLPHARVEELDYDTADQILVAALLGRGAWTYTFDERGPVDVALVLDFSGSMLSDACVGCEPKIDVLKQAVEIFLQIWKTLAVGNDQVTTVYFRTNVDKLNIGGSENLDVIDQTDAIIADVNSQTTTGASLTALGGGLQTGITELNDATRPRHVILFTDGMQNVDPGIRYPQLDIVDGEFSPNSGVAETTPATDLDILGGIRVHTIGVGATLAFETQLADISDATSGLTKITTAPDEDLIQFYIEELIEILRDFSPQLITYRKETSSGQAIESVDINPSAKQVLFKVSYPEGRTIDIRIEKDGHDVTSLAHRIEGDFYDIYHYPFDRLAQVKAISNNNAWNVMLSNGNPSLKYQLAVIADEEVLDYNFDIIGPLFTSGTSVTLITDVFIKKKLYRGNLKVTALLKSPKNAIGNLLSKYKIPKNGKLKFEKGATLGEKKLAYMLRDEKYQKILKPKISKMELKQEKGGHFYGLFNDTKVCGNYSVEFLIQGKNEEVGSFERTETRNFIINFGKFDEKGSEVKVEKAKGKSWILSLKPIDSNGNLLGPDQLQNLNFNIKGGKVLSEKDMGDGSYEYTFSLNKKKGKLQLKYRDQILLNTESLNKRMFK